MGLKISKKCPYFCNHDEWLKSCYIIEDMDSKNIIIILSVFLWGS